MVKAVIYGVVLTLSLLGMILLGFDTQQVKAQPILLSTDKDIYSVGENVTVCLLNSGMTAELVGGYPAWQIYTFPEGEPVYPAFFVFLEWVLMPGANDTIIWNQHNDFTGNFVEAGEYAVMDNQGWGTFAFFSIVSSPVPVGGYSIQKQVNIRTEPVLPYVASVATLTAIFTEFRRKTKRKR